MSKIAIIALKAVGGAALFGVSYVGFAKVNGVPLNDLPGIGRMFPAQAASSEHEKEADHSVDIGTHTPPAPTDEAAAKAPEIETPPTPQVEEHAAIAPRPKELRAGIFDMLDGDSLYTQDELRALADSLRTKNHQADQRGAELDRREDLLADRLSALDERRRVLDEFASQLDSRDRVLKAREAELDRDANSANSTRKELPSADLSAFFQDGDTEVLIERLASFSPSESAQILLKLPPARARELLDGLPNARWREFAEAYARAAQKP